MTTDKPPIVFPPSPLTLSSPPVLEEPRSLSSSSIPSAQTSSTPVYGRLPDETDASKEFDSLAMARVYPGSTLDSDQEASEEENEPLSKAGAWTIDEAAQICKRKMIRLQGLYIEQFKRLRHVLQLRYDQYRRDLEKSRGEPLSGAASSRVLSPELRAKSRALRRYRKRRGHEALLRRCLRERRVAAVYGEEATESAAQKRSQAVNHNQKCVYSDGEGVTCVGTSMPFSSYCFEHICGDSKQFLYAPCSRFSCAEPVLKSDWDPHCLLHAAPVSMEMSEEKVSEARQLQMQAMLNILEADKRKKELEEEKRDESLDGITIMPEEEDAPSFKKYLNLGPSRMSSVMAKVSQADGAVAMEDSGEKEVDMKDEEGPELMEIQDEKVDDNEAIGEVLSLAALVKAKLEAYKQRLHEKRDEEEDGRDSLPDPVDADCEKIAVTKTGEDSGSSSVG